MTLVVGFRFADEVIIGADSRRIEQRTGNRIDDTGKVFDCTLGLISAAGEFNTIRAVVAAVMFSGNNPADEIGPAIQRLLPANDPARTATQWLATLLSGNADNGYTVNMSHVSAGNNFQPTTIDDESFKVLYPDGITQAQKTTVETGLAAALDNALDAEDNDARRDSIVHGIHEAITTVAAHNIGVSTRIQIGIHDSQGAIRVSNIADTVAELEFPDN